MMHSISVWNLAQSPNYVTNIDKQYPYSEVPYIGNYKLVKIPQTNALVDHVDYWGEGLINAREGTSGFSDCYNINHQYQLVSNGPDRDIKIPNRIPVISYTNCNTSSYIKDNSVKLVTLMGAPINKSCAKDIARMVNNESGKVVVYGINSNTAYIKTLREELQTKSVLFCRGYTLEERLAGVTLFGNTDCLAYLNVTDLTVELQRNVKEKGYENAVNITKMLDVNNNSDKIQEAITNLLKEGNKSVMEYAYKLWNGDLKNIVNNNFPVCFKLILNEENVKIINNNNMFALKLDTTADADGNRLVFGDEKDKGSEKIFWKLIPVWENDKVFFKIKNVKHGKFLTLESKETGDKTVRGVTEGNESSFQWSLDPIKVDDNMLFYIINRKYNQALKLHDNTDSVGDKQALGNNGSAYGKPEIFGWFIAP